ncbi:hypothetical protein [Pseudomonas aeruginosa]|uniref:hypothetical protein n=1 Tax=Pseudomonas aeruginosa TaxID=287 RepID=UPI0019111D75|nr:hypothetical protein [Pseudomonas aeruginosa]MBH9455412.1 hypothetical protein [Pseudomonas aeruginosa]MBH9462191.1 hypothetical protein [Pseudomonas aeruginosa]MBO2860265.1 hypothetical protein [Pseudomonas aeruginosa]MBO2938874.1 hypothetical protein [Pseudomonas aeruginosa]MDC8988098.1 hypothetical protein [Pseudomonas aeruginosa]
MPDMREEFEDRFPIPEEIEWRNTDYFPVQTDNVHAYVALAGVADRYTSMWQAWKASRAALRVRLPKPYGSSSLDAYPELAEFNRGIRECLAALQRAGIEVKP